MAWLLVLILVLAALGGLLWYCLRPGFAKSGILPLIPPMPPVPPARPRHLKMKLRTPRPRR